MKTKTEATYQIILAIAGNRNVKGIELQPIWEMVESYVITKITFSMEAVNLTKVETKSMNRILDNIISFILIVPVTTPRETQVCWTEEPN